MTRRPFLILLEFVAITVPLTWWWLSGGVDLYWGIFQRLAFPLLEIMGVNTFSPGLVRDRMINWIPFLALMLITPDMGIRRRFGGLAGGLVLIFFSHVLLAYWAWVSFTRDGQTEGSMAHFFPALLAVDAVPFVLWAILANRFLLGLISRVFSGQASSGGVSGDSSETNQ